MKRLLLLCLACLCLLSSCAPLEELTLQQVTTAEVPQTEGGVFGEALAREVVRGQLLPLLYGDRVPVIPEQEPAPVEEYRGLLGQNLKDALPRLGLPYDLGDSPEYVRYLSREGYDVWLILSQDGSVYAPGRVLHVEVNTREESSLLLQERLGISRLSQKLWVLSSLSSEQLMQCDLSRLVSQYGAPFSLKKSGEGEWWYYLADMGKMLVLEVAEENAALAIRSQSLKKADAEELLPLEEGMDPADKAIKDAPLLRKLSQEKTGAWLKSVCSDWESTRYTIVPAAAAEESYLALIREGAALEEMLSRFGVPYDVKEEQAQGEFRCRYFSEEGNDVIVTLRDYGEGFRVDKVSVFRRELADEMLRSRYSEMKELTFEPQVIPQEENTEDGRYKHGDFELLSQYGAPYLESKELGIIAFGIEGIQWNCYHIAFDGRKIERKIYVSFEGAVKNFS